MLMNPPPLRESSNTRSARGVAVVQQLKGAQRVDVTSASGRNVNARGFCLFSIGHDAYKAQE